MRNLTIHQTDLKLLHDPDKWTEYNLDTDRGLLLLGPPGVGKTYFMRHYLDSKTAKKTAYDFERLYAEQGLDCIKPFVHYDLFVDDLGIESPMVQNYGTKFYPIKTLIFERHKLYTEYKFDQKPKFHATTNLSLKGLESYYDTRVLDRLYEFVNFIFVKGESYRKNS